MRGKAVYYRSTDPETGKQKWVKIEGLLAGFYNRRPDKGFLSLDRNIWFLDNQANQTSLYTNLGPLKKKMGITNKEE